MNQTITLDQLARLYQARNEANKRMSQAMRSKDATLIRLATVEAGNFNRAYDAAQRAYKRQQKAERKAQWRKTMINFYLDARDEIQTSEPCGAARGSDLCPAHRLAGQRGHDGEDTFHKRLAADLGKLEGYVAEQSANGAT